MKGKLTVAQSLLGGLIVVALMVGGAIWYVGGGQQQQVIQDGYTPPGYVPFPLGTLSVGLKDNANPTSSVSTSTVKGRVYDISTSDSAVASPATQFLDSVTISSGALAFAGKKVQTSNQYKVRIWDDQATEVWYAKLITANVPALNAELGASAQYTAPDVYLNNIGTFGDMYATACTGAGGGSLPTGVTSGDSTNTISINRSIVTDETLTVRCTVGFGNTESSSLLKNAIMRPVTDQSNSLPTTAFSAATLSHLDGSNFNLPSDILSYVTGQTPIILGDLSASDAGRYYLQLNLLNDSLTTVGMIYHLRLDDLGNYLATDAVAGQDGAPSVSMNITVTQ